MKATNGLYRDYGVYIRYNHLDLGGDGITYWQERTFFWAGATSALSQFPPRVRLGVADVCACEVEREQSLCEVKQTSNANISLNTGHSSWPEEIAIAMSCWTSSEFFVYNGLQGAAVAPRRTQRGAPWLCYCKDAWTCYEQPYGVV